VGRTSISIAKVIFVPQADLAKDVAANMHALATSSMSFSATN
jgi:hypothetical protein